MHTSIYIRTRDSLRPNPLPTPPYPSYPSHSTPSLTPRVCGCGWGGLWPDCGAPLICSLKLYKMIS